MLRVTAALSHVRDAEPRHQPAVPPDRYRRGVPVRGETGQTRLRLLRAAAAVLAEYGMAASMNAIARRAGLTKMTLYRHFASKEDLVLAVMAEHFDRLTAIADEVDALDSYLERAILQIGPDR